MPSINLPYGNNSFDSNRLKEHIRRTGRDYIIQGQKICRRIDHPKPNSLDCWLRDNYASNPDTKQAVNEVISDLVNTGDFVKEDFHCPDSHRRCKGIRIAEGEKASSLFTGYPKLRAPDELYVKEMNYSHFQHRHNFAVWCAARAVQRGFVKTPVLKEAIEKSGIVEFVRKNENKKIPQEKFDKFHGEWCDSIIKTWENMNVKGSSYPLCQ